MSQWGSIEEIVADVRAGKVTASQLVEKSLKLIDECADYNAVITSLKQTAHARAKAIDAGDKKGRLVGVPFIAKDNFLSFGGETTAASNMLKGFEAPYQATVIDKLEREGAICVAKANLDAFAHGSSTENSDFGPTKNPVDKTRVPGGSSGGSAAAVALELAPFALGTETGGSIRLPASFCGVVGYKPTYGLVSRSGIVAMASSCDVAGPLTRSVEDAALILDVVAGRDRLDATTVEREKSYIVSSNGLKGKTIGVIKQFTGDNVASDVKLAVKNSLEKMEKSGASLKEISLPSLDYAIASYYIIQTAEVSSNLSRYDGQRFSYSDKDAKTLEESYVRSRSVGFGKEAKRRIILGTFVLTSGYYDAYYKQAQLVRAKIIKEYNQAFSEVDFLASPTAGTTAFKLGEVINPLQMYLTDEMTVGANLAGLPAISLPVGSGDNGMPIGLQLIGQASKDQELLTFAKSSEEIL